MKFLFVVLAVISCSLAGPVPDQRYEDGNDIEYFMVEKDDGTYAIEYLTNATIEAFASESDVTFYLYTRNNRNGQIFTSNQLSSLQGFNRQLNTLVIAHGWNNNFNSAVNTVIRSSALASHDINVIVVDWAPVANRNYLTARSGVVPVGQFVGNMLRNLVSTQRISWASLTLVGHSLGAHVVGNAGAAVSSLVGTIVGLDPALPLFSINDISNRIDPTDGQFVQIIHTNGGLLGFAAAIGDSDYYPNGGSSQPGCGIDIAGSCAHSRAYDFYAESLQNHNFWSRRCASNADFTAGRCSAAARSRMGGMAVDNLASGSYFLATNSRTPFALG